MTRSFWIHQGPSLDDNQNPPDCSRRLFFHPGPPPKPPQLDSWTLDHPSGPYWRKSSKTRCPLGDRFGASPFKGITSSPLGLSTQELPLLYSIPSNPSSDPCGVLLPPPSHSQVLSEKRESCFSGLLDPVTRAALLPRQLPVIGGHLKYLPSRRVFVLVYPHDNGHISLLSGEIVRAVRRTLAFTRTSD